jgi:hypothetical protein
MAQLDINIDDQGTVCLFTAISELAKDWISSHLRLEGWECLGSSFAVEHRFAGPLVEGMLVDGLRVG